MRTGKSFKLTVVFLLTLALGGCTPKVQIISPADGASFDLGEEIIFSGEAMNVLGISLPEEQLVWTVDGEEIGTGALIKKSDLSVGTHIVKLSATSKGDTGFDEVTITVGNTNSSTTTTANNTSTTSTTTTANDTSTTTTANDTSTTTTANDTSFSHTITIDGTNDFTASEQFSTTSGGYYGYVSWDDSYLYIGVQGTEVGIGSSTKWILIYLGGSVGTTQGLTYNTQSPLLPFAAQWHVRWRADGVYTNALQYNGATWADAGWNFSGNIGRSGNYFEMRIPLSAIGSPATSLKVHLSMINDADGVEFTWCGVPNTSFADGDDPDYVKYYDFNLTSSATPNSYSPQP